MPHCAQRLVQPLFQADTQRHATACSLTRFSRTGLLSETCFRNPDNREKAILLREVGLWTLALHVRHRFPVRTPTDPPASCPADAFVWASGALKPSPSALSPSRGCTRLQGVRSPFRPTEFPVYASPGSFGASLLLHRCNTRYGWLARPYPVGTFTPQETPSFAWRTNGSDVSGGGRVATTL